MHRKEMVERGARGIRASWRMEMQPDDVETTARLLAGLPRPSEEPTAVRRLAAAGQDVIELRHLAARTRQMVDEGELPLRSHAEGQVLVDVLRGLTELVGRIEAHLGAFTDESEPGRQGVRHVFLIDVDPEHHQSARWAVDVGHQAGDAPTPVEPVGSMMLRAIGEDLREVERFLVALAAEVEPGELRDLVVEVHTGGGGLAGAIEDVLRAPGGTPADDGLSVRSETAR